MTKLFTHPAGGYLLETSTGNYRFNDVAVITTTETGDGMDEAYPDSVVQGVVENAQAASANVLLGREVQIFKSFIQHLIETAE